MGKSLVHLNDHYGDVRVRYSTRCIRLGNISRTPSLIEEATDTQPFLIS